MLDDLLAAGLDLDPRPFLPLTSDGQLLALPSTGADQALPVEGLVTGKGESGEASPG